MEAGMLQMINNKNSRNGEMINMNKKRVIIILTVVLVITLFGMAMFTSLGREITQTVLYKLLTPKETVQIEEQDKIKITYTYSFQEESFDIEITDKELIEMIRKNISNKKLTNYSGQIGLAVFGEYTVYIGDDINFRFDNYDDDGYVMIKNKDKGFLTKINPEILSKVIEIVDVKLTEKASIFKTQKITITNKEDKQINIERKTALEYIFNDCKNIYTKEMNYEPNIVRPDYEIDFNNGVKILKYKQNDRGFLIKDGIMYEAYNLQVLDSVLENAFDNLEEKEKMFTTDKITIISPNKIIEITDKDIIEKITTPIIYSKIQEREWTKNYDITEEYNNGIKIKINNYEFLIPGKVGNVTIGNRYIISEDKTISLCFLLSDLEEYVNELLGIKKKKHQA